MDDYGKPLDAGPEDVVDGVVYYVCFSIGFEGVPDCRLIPTSMPLTLSF